MFFRKNNPKDLTPPKDRVVARANLLLNMEAEEFEKHLSGGRTTLLDVYAVQYLEEKVGSLKEDKTKLPKPNKTRRIK